MAKIEIAYNLEIHDVIDPMEANELWLDGILKDKRAFKCIDENCDAGITCKNMDTYADNRKQNPCFIMSKRENTHSPNCKVYKELEEKTNKKRETKGERKSQYIGKKVCFHVERPENHRTIERREVNSINDNGAASGEDPKKRCGNSRRHNSNYYRLNSLILYYIDSRKNGTLEQDTVEMDFGKNKKYTYTLNNLFKRIQNENEITDRNYNQYVYYGKGRVYRRKNDGGYDLVFSEKFIGSEKTVRCIIKKEVIDKCQYGKQNYIKLLESAIGKERLIYILSSKNVIDKYNTVYLNIRTIDCIAISDIDLEGDDEKGD